MVSFGVVIPSKNAVSTIGQSLLSVLTAAHHHDVSIHVQDGASTDGSLELVREWAAIFLASPRINFSLDSRPDSGVADALNAGFQRVSGDWLTWLGADDLFLPWTFDSVSQLVTDVSNIGWCTGLAAQISEKGVPVALRGSRGLHRIPSGFSQQALTRGRHGSRYFGMIQQEGTFWTRDAWEGSGGYVDTSLTRAFDFELWCRLARHSRLVQVPVPLGVFRKRSGQLSGDRKAYISEVRATRQKIRKEVTNKYANSRFSPMKVFAQKGPEGWFLEQKFIGPRLPSRLVDRGQTLLRSQLAKW